MVENSPFTALKLEKWGRVRGINVIIEPQVHKNYQYGDLF